MAPTSHHGDGNGSGQYPGWQRCLLDVGRTFGVPTVLLLLICYWLLWQVTPPVVSAMSTFITATIETQAKLAKTQADIAESQKKLVELVEQVSKAAEEIVIAEKATQAFMAEVESIHKQQMVKLDTIEKAVTKEPIPESKN